MTILAALGIWCCISALVGAAWARFYAARPRIEEES